MELAWIGLAISDPPFVKLRWACASYSNCARPRLALPTGSRTQQLPKSLLGTGNVLEPVGRANRGQAQFVELAQAQRNSSQGDHKLPNQLVPTPSVLRRASPLCVGASSDRHPVRIETVQHHALTSMFSQQCRRSHHASFTPCRVHLEEVCSTFQHETRNPDDALMNVAPHAGY
jgi:hypothetical protein